MHRPRPTPSRRPRPKRLVPQTVPKRRPRPRRRPERRRLDPPHPARRAAGFHLLEAALALLVTSSILFLTVPPIVSWAGGLRLELAAGEVAGAMHMARLYAIRENANVAVKFRVEESGEVTQALYRDGDGDGVLNADIDAGVDPEVRPPRRLAHFGRQIRFGFPPGPAPWGIGQPRRRLDRLDDPIRFNVSDLASFSARGTATPGTVYLTDSRRHLSAVRVSALSGKITVLDYDPRAEVWR